MEQHTGFLDDLSAEQNQKVQQLQQRFSNQLAKYPELNTKWHLLRFCRARQFDMKKVDMMLDKFFKWRDQKDMKRIANRDFRDFTHLMQNHESGRYGVDVEGRPIIIERVGLSNSKEIMNVNDPITIEDYFIQMYERSLFIEFPIASQFCNKRVEQTFLIVDLKNVNIGKIFDNKFKEFLKFIAVMSQDYYPEMLGKMFIVNAPFLFKGVWSVVKLWLDKKTKSKIEMHSDVPIKRIQEFLNIDNIPTFLGGKCERPIRENFGPWKDEIVDSIEHKTFFLRDRTPEYDYFYTSEERNAFGGPGSANVNVEKRVNEGPNIATVGIERKLQDPTLSKSSISREVIHDKDIRVFQPRFMQRDI